MDAKTFTLGPNSRLSHLDLEGHDFRGLDLRYSDFHCSNLAGAKFDGAILHGCNFLRTNLGGASFLNCEFYDPSDQYTPEDFSNDQDSAMMAISDEITEQNFFEMLEQDQQGVENRQYEGLLTLDSAAHFENFLLTTRLIIDEPLSIHHHADDFIETGFFWHLYTSLPEYGTDLDWQISWEFYSSPSWLTLWNSWARSVAMHNKSACFDLCDHNSETIWPSTDHLDDYPLWNTPPMLIWSRCNQEYMSESFKWEPISNKDCNICERVKERAGH